MREALKDNAWILKINPSTVVTVDHIRVFFPLWMLVHDFRLHAHTEDDIVWKHSNDRVYLAASAYKAQFLGMVLSPLDRMVWKAWAPLKVRFFAWLALQNRIWTADRLEKRRLENCGYALCARGCKKRGLTSSTSAVTPLGMEDGARQAGTGAHGYFHLAS